MNLETFFEKFDLFADCPNAVQKMRELILELAVQGKLVEQRDEEGSGLELLEDLRNEREFLASERKIKHRRADPFENDSRPFDIPGSWTWARLFEVGYELGQKVPDSRFTYIDVGGIDAEVGAVSDRVEVLDPSQAPSRARKMVDFGTVIYSTVRPYLLNVAIVDKDYEFEPIASTAFGILHPFTGICNRFLFYWLRGARFTEYVNAQMKGVAYPAINDEKFYSGYIPLPPLAEQKRIVAKVDELMALCDALEVQQKERETRRTALAKASLAAFAEAPSPQSLELLFHPSYAIAPADLRKSILTLAVQGKLVEQREEEGDVCGLEVSGKGKELAQIESNELPFGLPQSWKWCRLGWVAELLNGDRGKNYPNREEYVQSGVPWINTGHIEPDGSLSLETMNYLTRDKYNSLRSGKILRGDLVYCLRGATLGKTAIVEQFAEGAVASSLVIVRLANVVYSRYAYFYLTSPVGRELIYRFDNGSAQPNLSANSVKLYVFPLPPLAEQKRIVAKVDELMALVDRVEAKEKAAHDTSSRLLDAVVAELSGRAAA